MVFVPSHEQEEPLHEEHPHEEEDPLYTGPESSEWTTFSSEPQQSLFDAPQHLSDKIQVFDGLHDSIKEEIEIKEEEIKDLESTRTESIINEAERNSPASHHCPQDVPEAKKLRLDRKESHPDNASVSHEEGSERRPRKEAERKKNHGKKQHILGLQHTSHGDIKVEAVRTIGPPCACNRKCFDRVGRDNVKKIFKDFWSLSDWDMQTAYLQKQIYKQNVECNLILPEKHRQHTRLFFVTVHGNPITVCRPAFASMHGIMKARMDKALKEMTSTPKKLADCTTDKALMHIRSFPTITSHYSCKASANFQYLAPDIISHRQMYTLYKTWLKENHAREAPVTMHNYCNLLKVHFPNLNLYKPPTNTCKECATYRLKLKNQELPVEERISVRTGHVSHLAKASAAYNLPSVLLKNTDASVMIVCLGLQQALPTPKTSSGISFYKRKMWTYCFNIHDYKSGRGYVFLWDEVTAKRGILEICSCIDKFITLFVPENVDELIVFSDNCAGQNKNWILLLCYLSFIHKGRFKEITHIYFQAGHSYNMAADHNLELIEKCEQKADCIFTPEEHGQLISTIKKDGEKFVVTQMAQEDFKDWEVLANHAAKRSVPNAEFSECCYFRLSADYLAGYSCDTSYSLYDGHSDTRVSLVKESQAEAELAFNLSSVVLPRKYVSRLHLADKKVEDLKVLISELVLPDVNKLYWDNVLGIINSENNDVIDIDDGGDDDDSEPLLVDDIDDYL